MSYWLVGGKYDDLLIKIAIIRVRRGKKREKRTFLLYSGGKISFWKKAGGEAKISIIWIIFTPALITICYQKLNQT